MINESNYNYLVKLLEDTGFGTQFNSQLRAGMEKGLPELALSGLANFRKDLAKISPILKKGRPDDPTSNYFLNKYMFQIVNCPPDSPKAVPQTIYVDARPEFRPNNLSPYQVSRLMDRASIRRDIVAKNGSVNRTWYKTNFQVINDYGNFERFSMSDEKFNVERQLSKPNIVESTDPKMFYDIVNKLADGESAKITFEDGKKVWNLYISANIPMGFNAYDLDQKRFLKDEELDILIPPLYPRKEKQTMDVKEQATASDVNVPSQSQSGNVVTAEHGKASDNDLSSEKKAAKAEKMEPPAAKNRRSRGKGQSV